MYTDMHRNRHVTYSMESTYDVRYDIDREIFDYRDLIDELGFEASGDKQGSVKAVLDELFKDIKFDKRFLQKLIRFNISFITTDPEVRDFMGGRMIGCFHIEYDYRHKAMFYDDLFNMDLDEVLNAIKTITTIPKNFKIARDDINLVCFYIAHRFLNEASLSKNEKMEGAKEALNQFGYRTMILISSLYWKYPITRDKAVTLIERLSKRYDIANKKNWNEYIHFRSDSYLSRKYLKLLQSMNDDRALPNAITDLYNRYKSTTLNIYEEMVAIEAEDVLVSSKNVVTDIEGRDVLMDRLSDPTSYADKVIDSFITRDGFIRRDYIDFCTRDNTSISQDQLRECLELVWEYHNKSPGQMKEVNDLVVDFITDTIQYLQDNKIFINSRTNVVEVVSMITGSILYSRGTDISITEVKRRGEELLLKIYKAGKVTISNRNLTNMRNVFFIYLLITSLLS